MTVEVDLDKELFIALPIFIVAVAMNLGVFNPPSSLSIVTETLFSLGPADITVSRIAALGSLLFILVNRDVSIDDTKGIDVWIVYATSGLVLTPPFVPVLQNTLVEPGINILAMIGQVMGFVIVSALN